MIKYRKIQMNRHDAVRGRRLGGERYGRGKRYRLEVLKKPQQTQLVILHHAPERQQDRRPSSSHHKKKYM